MPRSKRNTRASGVTRSLGGYTARSLQCAVCKRWLPRDAIAHIRRKPMSTGAHVGQQPAFCGECWHSGRAFREDWTW